ncbi:MAG TPA: TIGR02757 family protein [Thermoanaerobaculia bacterium]|jgi:uncharacterized protein (TIGR02757 family)
MPSPELGRRLEALYLRYGPETAETDPIVFPLRYDADEDREVAGWIATAFAYGQVRTIQDNVGRLLAALGPRPARGLDAIRDFRALAREELRGFRHRFHGAADAAALLFAIAAVRAEAGSVRAFFEREHREEDADVAGMLTRVVARLTALDWRPALGNAKRRLPEGSPVRFFFPDPAAGSACKRWNLYLRWMVRHDRLDFGLWRGIPTRRLVVPTDTHVHRIARRLGLTRRAAADWKAARQITDALSRFDPEDPVRFDYALCRLGILDVCTPEVSRCQCGICPVQDACRVGRRRFGSRRTAYGLRPEAVA